VEHVYVRFGDPSCIGFEMSCGKQTEKQTNKHKTPLQCKPYPCDHHRRR